MTALRAGSATDVGLVRANNQDNLLIAAPLFAVADGMGGHAAGEVASLTAVDALGHALGTDDRPPAPEAVAEAVKAANRAVWEEAQANPEYRGMGTTLTAIALVDGHDHEQLAVVNVGDSRTYRLRHDVFEQLTVDHSLVAELVAEGQIDASEAEVHPQRHVLTRALGVYPDVDVDLLTLDPAPGDRYLLCSDGLSREVSDTQIASVLRRLADPTDAARELVAEAKLHGGSDNITVVVVDVVDPASPEAAAEDATVSAAAAGRLQGKGPAVVATEPEPAPDRPSRRARRKAAKPDRPRNRVVTVRVVAFFVLLLAVVGVGAAGTAWYARSSYYVGLRGDRITIYQGRPGGVLWWKPTVAETTSYTTGSIESYHVTALRSGVQEASLTAARRYVSNLRDEAVAAGVASTPVTIPGFPSPSGKTS